MKSNKRFKKLFLISVSAALRVDELKKLFGYCDMKTVLEVRIHHYLSLLLITSTVHLFFLF